VHGSACCVAAQADGERLWLCPTLSLESMRSLVFMRKSLALMFVVVCLFPLIPLSTVSTASASKAIPVCSYRQLEVAVAWGPGAAAGSVGIPFIIASTSKSTCTLIGYPKLIASPDRYKGHSLKIEHSGGMIFGAVKPRLVVIKPGADASFGLNYGEAGNQNDPNGAPCLVQNIYVTLPLRANTFEQNFETTVDFNFCFSGFEVGLTAIQSGPLPKEG
jgi:hypothetical protein